MLANGRQKAREIDKAGAQRNFGQQKAVLALGHRHVLEMRGERVRRIGFDDFVRLLQKRDAVAGVEADADLAGCRCA